MSAIINPVTSNMRGGAYGANWGTVYSLELEPQVWKEWYQAFGKGFSVFDWLTIVGSSVSVKARDIDAFTDQAIEKAVQVSAAGVASAGHVAGASRTFVINALEYDEPTGGSTATNPYLRQYDTVFMDPQYTNKDVPTQWIVTSRGADTANTTIYPLDTTVQMNADMGASTYFMVGPNLQGIGTGQPGPRKNGTTSDTFYTAIVAETAEIKGGVNAEKLYRNDLDKSGRSTLWSKAQVETEFLLNAGMDKEIFLGQVNTNTSNAVIADADSTNQAARGTQGLWHWVESDGMEQAYAGSYDLAYFDQIKEYLRSQGVTDTNVAFLAGSNLHKQVENTVLDYIKAYSGGTSLVEAYGQVGMNVQKFKKNGITCELAEIVSFDNANSYAVMDTYFRDAGLIIPKSLATVSSSGMDMGDIYGYSAGDKVKIPNVVIGYLNNNGENRTRMVHPLAGVNGYGYPAAHEWDHVKLLFKAEFMLIVNLANQMLKIVKEGTF
jgi:hypothetical protein